MKINGGMLSNKFVEQIYFHFWCFYQDLTKLIWTSISYGFRNVHIFSTVSWISYDVIHTNPNQKRVLSTIIFKWKYSKVTKIPKRFYYELLHETEKYTIKTKQVSLQTSPIYILGRWTNVVKAAPKQLFFLFLVTLFRVGFFYP